MVRAILEGHKTQTRRVIKPQPDEVFERSGDVLLAWGEEARSVSVQCPFGQLGDRLWVKEAWRTQVDFHDEQTPAQMCGAENLLYDADADWSLNKTVGRPRSPIHMPRWASRITLEVFSVRVERLQAITEADIRAEGFGWEYDDWRDEVSSIAAPPGSTYQTLTEFFAGRWDDINHKRGHGWDTNPWVWVIEFKQVTP